MKNSFKEEENMKVKPGDLYLYKSERANICNTWLVLKVDEYTGRVIMICIGSNVGIKGDRGHISSHVLKTGYEKLL